MINTSIYYYVLLNPDMKIFIAGVTRNNKIEAKISYV